MMRHKWPRDALNASLPALLLVWTAWVAADGLPQATFRSSVEAVRIDALVTANGHPVRGLTADDFDVFDEGVRQRITGAAFERMPLNVTLVLDISDSVVGSRLTQLKAAGQAVIAQLERDDRASLVTFSEELALRTRPTPDFAAVRNALDAMQPGGGTRLFDALHAGLVLGDSDARRNLLIVFSDGADTSSILTLPDVAATARRSDVVVYAVTAGLFGRRSELHDVAGMTGGSVLDIEAVKDIQTAFNTILQEFRQRYLLMYTPAGVSKGGWHRVEVRVRGRKVSVQARPGYEAG
jgi:VWFA-related protein